MLHVDEQHFPLIVATCDGPVSLEELEHYFTQLERRATAQERFVVVIDARRMKRPDPETRAGFAATVKAHESTLRGTRLATAWIINSALVVGALTALRWVVPAKTPEDVTRTARDAWRFVSTRGAAAGLAFPPSAAERMAALDQDSVAGTRSPSRP